MAVKSVAEAIKEGLSAWKSFIETRQEAYERKMDKRLRTALDCAEQFILLDKDLKAEENDKVRQKIEARKRYWERKFFKLNQ